MRLGDPFSLRRLPFGAIGVRRRSSCVSGASACRLRLGRLAPVADEGARRSPISPALRKTGTRATGAVGSKDRPRPMILPLSSTSRTISSIGPISTRSAYSAWPPSRAVISAPMVSLLLRLGQAGRVGGLEFGGRAGRIDGEGAEEIRVLGIDHGAAGEQLVEQARIAVRHEDVDVVAGGEPAHVLEAHRAAVAHAPATAAPSAGCARRAPPGCRRDAVGEQLVMGGAGQFELDLVQRPEARRHDQAEPARQRPDRPALHDQRHQHDDEGDVEDERGHSRARRAAA